MGEPPDPRLIDAREVEDDLIVNLSLRPRQFTEFVGQPEVVQNLRVAVQAARQRREPLEHVLLSGPPGLGKTSLAHLIAHEMGAKITVTSGPAIGRAGDLAGILTNLERGDILFVDEIHRLAKVVEEYLYPAMEGFQIDFVTGEGPYAKPLTLHLKPFTLIGATTRAGLLTTPLRNRFGLFFHLDFYGPEDLQRIVQRSTGILGIGIEEQAGYEIARRARGTPRVANRLLRRVRDYAQVHEIRAVTGAVAVAALEAHGIDREGLDSIDRKVLHAIVEVYNGGPVGVDALAAALNEETDTVIDLVEPYLLKRGYLRLTPRGREVTPRAYEHLQLPPRRRQPELF